MLPFLSIIVYLLTCSPGEELYAHYGHTALRVRDTEREQADYVFNYGLFDFNTDHFYLKFIEGKTWYELGMQPTAAFYQDFQEEGRSVYSQQLNLTEQEAQQLLQNLLINYLPQNRKYLYNFVYNNCATKPYDMIEAVTGPLSSPYKGWAGASYRQALSHYTGHNSVIDHAIQLLFGSRADKRMSSRERLFLPEELMHYMSQAVRADGTPIVVNEQTADFQPPAVAWYERYELYLPLFMVLQPLFLMVVTFLCCFSIHPLVGLNIRLLFIPICIVCFCCLFFFRRLRSS